MKEVLYVEVINIINGAKAHKEYFIHNMQILKKAFLVELPKHLIQHI